MPLTIAAFPVLKLVDLVSRSRVARATTTVRFEHPRSAHLMRDIYCRKKAPGGLLRIEADPTSGLWRENITLGGLQLVNRYRLDVTEHEWKGLPTWQTWTTSANDRFAIDFRHPHYTVLSLVGDRSSVDGKHFQDWFAYVKGEGIEGIVVT